MSKVNKIASLAATVAKVNAVAKAESKAPATKAPAKAESKAPAKAPAKVAKVKVSKLDQMKQADKTWTLESLNALAASFTSGRKECPMLATWTDLIKFIETGANGHKGLEKNWPIILGGWVTSKGYHVRLSHGFKPMPESGQIPGLFHDNVETCQASKVFLVAVDAK